MTSSCRPVRRRVQAIKTVSRSRPETRSRRGSGAASTSLRSPPPRRRTDPERPFPPAASGVLEKRSRDMGWVRAHPENGSETDTTRRHEEPPSPTIEMRHDECKRKGQQGCDSPRKLELGRRGSASQINPAGFVATATQGVAAITAARAPTSLRRPDESNANVTRTRANGRDDADGDLSIEVPGEKDHR